MKFLPLLELNLIHGYYFDGRCPDFQITPTSTTQRLLKNHRCILRTAPNGIRILTHVTEQNTPLIPLSDGVTFAFQLQLQNSDFPLFTNLDIYNQITAPLYTNLDNSEALTLVSKESESTEQFTVVQSVPNVQYVLSGNPMVGLTSADFSITGLGPITAPTGYDPTTKLITVDTTSAQKGELFQVTYAAKPPQARGIFAEVAIRYSDAWPPLEAGSKEFQISFDPKAALWKYYIVADSAKTEFQINDQSADALVFSEANRTDLNQNPDTSDGLATSLAQKYPTKQRLRFVSDNAVPCQQQPRKGLQLRLADNLVIETLPNPALRNYDFVEVLKDGVTRKEPVLYQIVKYYTH